MDAAVVNAADPLELAYADLLIGRYDCVDRIILNAYFPLACSPGIATSKRRSALFLGAVHHVAQRLDASTLFGIFVSMLRTFVSVATRHWSRVVTRLLAP